MLRSLNHFNQKHHHIEIVVYQHKFPALLTQYPPVAISHITNILCVCVSSMRNGDVAFPLDVYFFCCCLLSLAVIILVQHTHWIHGFVQPTKSLCHKYITDLWCSHSRRKKKQQQLCRLMRSDDVHWPTLRSIKYTHSVCTHLFVVRGDEKRSHASHTNYRNKMRQLANEQKST